MEAIAICCPKCGWQARVATSLLGKQIRCRKCQTPFRVAVANDPPPTPTVQTPPEGPLPQALPLDVDETPPPADPTASSTPDSSAVAVATGVRAVWDLLVQVNDFYRSNHKLLWQRLAEYNPGRAEAEKANLSLCLHAGERYLNARHNNGAWEMELPACCVVCARPAEKEVTEARQAPDMTWPLWVPLALLLGDLLFAILLGFLTRGFRPVLLVGGPLLPVALATGCVIGYLLHREIPVTMRLRRCSKHQTATKSPRLLAHGETLVLRFSAAEVRKRFRRDSQRKPEAPKSEPDFSTTSEQPAQVPTNREPALTPTMIAPAPVGAVDIKIEGEQIVVLVGKVRLAYHYPHKRFPTLPEFLERFSQDLSARQVPFSREQFDILVRKWQTMMLDAPLPLGEEPHEPDESFRLVEELRAPLVMSDELTLDNPERPPPRRNELVLPRAIDDELVLPEE